MMNKKTLKTIIILILIIVGIFVLSHLRKYLNVTTKNYLRDVETFAKPVSEDNNLLKEFKRLFKERIVILACEEDINNDNRKDIVVISKLNDDISTVALLDMGEEFKTTEPIPAPRENQYMKFFNMDNEGAIEILITGEKKGQVGYAIYKYEDGRLIDIFGEGMEDCC